MQDRSIISVFAVFFLGIAIVPIATNGMFVPADPSEICNGNLCRAYRVFSEFQTLFAAGFAIVAAWYAAEPVWKQLRKMNIQQDIMAHEIIERRLRAIESNARDLETELTSYLNDVWRTIYDPYDEPAVYDPKSIDAEWADTMMSRADAIVSELDKQQVSRADTIKIEQSRASLIAALTRLSQCLNSIRAPARLAGEPEISCEMEKQLEQEEQEARANFDTICNEVDDARKVLRQVAALESDSIRQRLREIDGQLIRGHDQSDRQPFATAMACASAAELASLPGRR